MFPLHLMITASSIDFDRGGFAFDVRQRRQRTCACRERGDKEPILEVVAEGVEPDLGRRESDLGRPQEPRRIIDDPQDPQRCGMLPATAPRRRVRRAR